MYNVKEAAQKMSTSDSHRRRLLESRQTEGKKPGHDWIVDRKMKTRKLAWRMRGAMSLRKMIK